MVRFCALQARQLENQIDGKLVQLSKLGTSLSCSSSGFRVSDRAPLLGEDDDEKSANKFKALCEDIGGLLTRLSNINDALQDWAATSSTTPSAAVGHTLQRHKDILQDYQREFSKTRSNVMAAIERHDLLDSVHKDIDDYKSSLAGSSGDGGSGGNRRMAMLLKESEHARNSERMIDDQINIAVETRETLMNQRVAFKAIQTKLNDISHRFPMINNLVQKINFRKRRDTVIMGSVIGTCILFLLWYAFG